MFKKNDLHMSFYADDDIYHYTVMPFWFVNVGAYQRTVNKLFTDRIRDTMESYIDDMLVKCSK